jgi:hypothetical protein
MVWLLLLLWPVLFLVLGWIKNRVFDSLAEAVNRRTKTARDQ